MIKLGILVDLQKLKIIKECEYDDKRIDDIFVKFDHQITPIAYVFPAQNRLAVEEQLAKLSKAKKEYDDLVANIYYKILPRLR